MGFIFSTIKFLLKVAAASLGAFFLTGLADFILDFNPLLPYEIRSTTMKLAAIFFFLGLLVLIFTLNLRVTKWSLSLGFAIPTTVLVCSLIALIPLIVMSRPEATPVLLGIVSLISGYLLHVKLDLFRTLDLFDKEIVGAIQVFRVPRDYLEPPSPARTVPLQQQWNTPIYQFKQVLETFAYYKMPVGLRLEHTGNFYFLTWGPTQEDVQKQLHRLEGILKSQLPAFSFKKIPIFIPTKPPSGTKGSAATLSGEPINPEKSNGLIIGLTAVAERLQQIPSGAVVEIFASPTKPSPLQRWWLERQYNKNQGSSQHTENQTSPIKLGKSQKTITFIDHRAAIKAEKLERQINRLETTHLWQVRVAAAAWHQKPLQAQENAEILISILAGSLTPADPRRGFKIHTHWLLGNRTSARILRGNPTGRPTLLTSPEAATYFMLPRCDLGIPVGEDQTFYTDTSETPIKQEPLPPPSIHSPTSITTNQEPTTVSKQEIVVGPILRHGQPTQKKLAIPKDMFTLHTGVYGNTGSGKTTTSLSLVYQLYEKGVTPIIIVPEKVKDWRSLLHIIPGMRIYTAGDEQTAPLRFNPFQVPQGVLINRYIKDVAGAFIASWPTEGITREHVENVIETAYNNCGWDRRANKPGRPVMLTDLQTAMEQVYHNDLQYSADSNQDFWGILKARFDTLIRDPIIADMFNTPEGLTIEELLRQPTIIELRGLSDDQQALLTGLLVVGIAKYLEGQSTQSEQPQNGINNLLVLEEAHHILKRVTSSLSLEEGHSSRQKAINGIVKLLRQARALGLGVMLIDQLPGSMATEAVKLPGITIIHYLKDTAERELVGLQANCTEGQLRHIAAMKTGEAVIHLPHHSQPVNVQVLPIKAHIHQQTPEREWTDSQIKRHMKPIYLVLPHLRETHPIPLLTPTETVVTANSTSARVDAKLMAELLRKAQQSHFQKRYRKLLEQALTERDAQPAARYLVKLTQRVVKDPNLMGFYAESLLEYLARTLHTPHHNGLHDLLIFAIHDELNNQGEIQNATRNPGTPRTR